MTSTDSEIKESIPETYSSVILTEQSDVAFDNESNSSNVIIKNNALFDFTN